MLFKPYHLPMIRAGEKTVTRREWDSRQVIPGNTYIASDEMFTSHDEAETYIRVDAVYQEPLGEITEESARAEGEYDGVEDFREGYERVYGEGSWDPEKIVWVVEFEYLSHLYLKVQIEKHRRGERPPVEIPPPE